jgi:hypothetical protein
MTNLFLNAKEIRPDLDLLLFEKMEDTRREGLADRGRPQNIWNFATERGIEQTSVGSESTM